MPYVTAHKKCPRLQHRQVGFSQPCAPRWAAGGTQARRGLDNAAFIGLPSCSCSAGFYGLVLLLWRCKAPGKPAHPPLPAPPGPFVATLIVSLFVRNMRCIRKKVSHIRRLYAIWIDIFIYLS
jgi:hypothetical protein